MGIAAAMVYHINKHAYSIIVDETVTADDAMSYGYDRFKNFTVSVYSVQELPGVPSSNCASG